MGEVSESNPPGLVDDREDGLRGVDRNPRRAAYSVRRVVEDRDTTAAGEGRPADRVGAGVRPVGPPARDVDRQIDGTFHSVGGAVESVWREPPGKLASADGVV